MALQTVALVRNSFGDVHHRGMHMILAPWALPDGMAFGSGL